MPCRGEWAGGAHGTLVLLSHEIELEIVCVIDTPEATLNPRRPH
jgi:hypothetical protein